MRGSATSKLDLNLSAYMGVRPKVRWAAIIGLIVLPIVLVMSGVLMFDIYRNQITLEHRLAASQKIRHDIYAILRLTMQAESCERGFLISGAEKYRAGYNMALHKLPDVDKRLTNSISDPSQKQELATVTGLVAQKLETLSAAMAQRPGANISDLGALFEKSENESPLSTIKSHLYRLIEFQNQRIKSEEDDLNTIGRKAAVLIAVRFTCMAILIGGVAILIFLAMREREVHVGHLRITREKADAANEAKSEFLANMSHEIRTPLNGVLVMAQLLAREDLTAGQKQKLDVIRASGEDLMHVINDILDFSKIESGKLELELIEFDPEKVLDATLAGFSPVARDKGIELRLEIAPDARGIRLGDPSRLRQIVNNFVSNALKFTASGSVLIRIDSDGPQGLSIAVRDTGPGIPTDKMDLLFRKFSQLDASTTRQFGGTGLGLAICRELAILMGGRVWAESEVGVGSTFHAALELPYVREAGPSARDDLGRTCHADDCANRAVRVLAAEDNPVNQLVLSTLMEVFGFELTVVGDGRRAVETWAEGGFDLILMDVQMPEMDGVTATRLIRQQEARRGLARTPIVALSANAFSHQIAEYAEAGMDAHIAKPIELDALKDAIERLLMGEPVEQSLYA